MAMSLPEDADETSGDAHLLSPPGRIRCPLHKVDEAVWVDHVLGRVAVGHDLMLRLIVAVCVGRV